MYDELSYLERMGLRVTGKKTEEDKATGFMGEGLFSADIDVRSLRKAYTKEVSMEDAIRKSRALIEALPYMQSFKDKIVVVKFGGSAMVNIKTFQSILQDVVFMKTIGMRPVIVHGGGPYISSEMKKRGKNPHFVNGYRVTDKETLEIAVEVLIHQIGRLIIKHIGEMGAKGESVWDSKKSPVKARRFVYEGESGANDLGYVGEITEIENEYFIHLCENDRIPIVPPIAEGSEDENFNVNADNVAAFIAGSLKAEKLVFISNTHGISTDQSDPESFASTLHEDEVNKLIESGVIGGGMLPKANACISALREGVKKAHIIDGNIPHSLLLEIFTDKGIGTQIIV